MLSSSIPLHTILSDKFKNAELANKCKSHGRAKILRGETSRAFDYFPEIIIEPDLKRLNQLFRAILSDLAEYISEESTTPMMLEEYDHIELFIKNIAAKGCHELLSPQGIVRSDFLHLMGWEDIRNKIDILELISAYVSTIYAQLGNQNFNFVYKHQQAYASLTTFLNKKQHGWIEEILNEKGYTVQEKKTASPTKTSTHYRISPWLAVSAGFFVVSSLGYAAMSMFRKSPQQIPKQEVSPMEDTTDLKV